MFESRFQYLLSMPICAVIEKPQVVLKRAVVRDRSGLPPQEIYRQVAGSCAFLFACLFPGRDQTFGRLVQLFVRGESPQAEPHGCSGCCDR